MKLKYVYLSVLKNFNIHLYSSSYKKSTNCKERNITKSKRNKKQRKSEEVLFPESGYLSARAKRNIFYF